MLSSSILSLLVAVPLALATPTPGAANAGGGGGGQCSSASQAALNNEKQMITQSGLVADFLKTFNPTVTAKITYSPLIVGGTKEVNYGNTFKTIETAVQPPVYISRERGQYADSTYTVLFINFDNPIPSAPPALHVPFLHWQESGVQPCSNAPGSQTQFFIPSFPQSVDENRYTYLIYREPKGYVANPLLTITRAFTVLDDVNAFAASQGLTLVGANYFLEGQINNIPDPL